MVLAWRQLAAGPASAGSRGPERLIGSVLLLLAAFLVLGQHLRPLVTAWVDPLAPTEYASAPTPFWMVKLMDLGIIVPVAVAAGIGLLRGKVWARRVLYPLLTGYTCLAVSVTSMAVVMLVRQDPEASVAIAIGLAGSTVVLLTLVLALHRPLLHRSDPAVASVPSKETRA